MLTRGIVLRVSPVGESDRLVTILTEKAGVVRAFARNGRAAKSRLVSATQPFSFARFDLLERRDGSFLVREAQPMEIFFALREDLGRLSLGQYLCELAGAIAPPNEGAGQFLRLLAKALHVLCKAPQRPLSVVKAAFEMRGLSLAGYMPDLIGCIHCRRYDGGVFFFYPEAGELLCESCRAELHRSGGVALHAGALMALRHTVYAQPEKLFAFTLNPESQKELARASERFVQAQLERSFKTLDFYHQMTET